MCVPTGSRASRDRAARKVYAHKRTKTDFLLLKKEIKTACVAL